MDEIKKNLAFIRNSQLSLLVLNQILGIDYQLIPQLSLTNAVAIARVKAVWVGCLFACYFA